MNLDLIAQDLGVQITTGVLPQGCWGAYRHRTHTITLLKNLGPIQYRCTLAHELGHAHYRHTGSTARTERQASQWAARQLITQDAFMEAAYGADTTSGVAAILEVMPSDVETYIETLDVWEVLEVMDILQSVKTT